MINFSHSGGTGDIIYGLYTVKKICEENNDKCNIYLKRNNPCNNVIDIYDTLKRLLICQEYINDVIVVDDINGFFNWNFNFEFIDLDKFRNFLDGGHLINSHLKFMNKNNLIDNWKNETWINISEDIFINEPYIVINRTPRYRADNGKDVWKNSLKKYNNIKNYFIGLEYEYNEFCNDFNIEIEHYKVNDLYDTALMLKKAQITLCNPSSILALCISMNLNYELELHPICSGVVRTFRNNEIIMI